MIIPRKWLAILVLGGAGFLHGEWLFAADIDGFTEPFKTIDIAASETGLLEKVLVTEGMTVHKGDEVATMTLDLLQATLEIADRSMNAQGQLNSAKSELKMKTEMLIKLQGLRAKNHASQEELDRVAIEKEIAEARVLAVKEELDLRKLEHKRISLQIERRRLRSPIEGIVTRVWKDEAEFVAPNEPVVVTVVQLDPLLAVFSIPSATVKTIRREQMMKLKLGDQPADGHVETISPVTDAQSGTVLVKIRVPNATGKFRSGERCKLLMGDGPTQITDDRIKSIRR